MKSKAVKLSRARDAAPLSPARAVEADLAAVEAKLSTLLDSNEKLIAEICHYLVDGAGKRLRPTFVLLIYRACGGSDANVEDAVDVAISLELIHSATLLHDDIIDGGKLRRGKPSAYARYGFGPTLVAGDYLFCRAFELCGRFEERLIRAAAHACIQLTEGEMMEGRFRHSLAATLNDYIAVITRKTGSLFATAGRVASDLAGVPPPAVAKMEKLGNSIGLAFQMVDDLLDILGPEEKIGKPVGSDLRAGIPSLPVVLGVARNEELRRMLSDGGQLEGERLQRALALLRDPALVAEARAMATAQVRIARDILAELPASPWRDSLALLIDEQIDREA